MNRSSEMNRLFQHLTAEARRVSKFFVGIDSIPNFSPFVWVLSASNEAVCVNLTDVPNSSWKGLRSSIIVDRIDKKFLAKFLKDDEEDMQRKLR